MIGPTCSCARFGHNDPPCPVHPRGRAHTFQLTPGAGATVTSPSIDRLRAAREVGEKVGLMRAAHHLHAGAAEHSELSRMNRIRELACEISELGEISEPKPKVWLMTTDTSRNVAGESRKSTEVVLSFEDGRLVRYTVPVSGSAARACISTALTAVGLDVHELGFR